MILAYIENPVITDVILTLGAIQHFARIFDQTLEFGHPLESSGRQVVAKNHQLFKAAKSKALHTPLLGDKRRLAAPKAGQLTCMFSGSSGGTPVEV